MLKCPFCGFDNEDGALFCEQCKSDLSMVPAAPPAPKPAAEVPMAAILEEPIPMAAPIMEDIPMAAPMADIPMAAHMEDIPMAAPIAMEVPPAAFVPPPPPVPAFTPHLQLLKCHHRRHALKRRRHRPHRLLPLPLRKVANCRQVRNPGWSWFVAKR